MTFLEKCFHFWENLHVFIKCSEWKVFMLGETFILQKMFFYKHEQFWNIEQLMKTGTYLKDSENFKQKQSMSIIYNQSMSTIITKMLCIDNNIGLHNGIII